MFEATEVKVLDNGICDVIQIGNLDRSAVITFKPEADSATRNNVINNVRAYFAGVINADKVATELSKVTAANGGYMLYSLERSSGMVGA